MGKNTLEGKQFFKEEAAVKEFVENAKQRNYQPPYQHVLVVQADEECMSRIGFCEQKLDGYDAITIRETYLNSFNRYIKFVEDYDV